MEVYGYLGSWNNPSGWTLDTIDWEALTHILDAFAVPSTITPGVVDTTTLRGTVLINKAHEKNVRCLMSVGGAAGSEGFPKAVTPLTKDSFVTNLVSIMNSFGYDGIDIDWEFPREWDKTYNMQFMQSLYLAIKSSPPAFDGKPKELTFYTTTGFYDAGYDWNEINNYVDRIIQSGYDWKNPYNAPLYNPGKTQWPETNIPFEASINGFAQHLISMGVQRQKFLLGLPFYGSGNTNWGDVSASITPTYEPTPAEGYYVNQWYTDNSGFQAKINYIKNEGRPGIAIWEVSKIYPKTDLWQTIKIYGCLIFGTPTISPTVTLTVTGTPPTQTITLTHTITSTFSLTPTITVTLTPTMSIQEGVDNFNLNFTLGGAMPWWQATTSNFYYDGDAIVSGCNCHLCNCYVQTTVNGPGNLKFYWKISSQPDADYGKFFIDGILQNQISGEVGWHQMQYNIDIGLHTLRWSYSKNENWTYGSDKVWVDLIEWATVYISPTITPEISFTFTSTLTRTVTITPTITQTLQITGTPTITQTQIFSTTASCTYDVSVTATITPTVFESVQGINDIKEKIIVYPSPFNINKDKLYIKINPEAKIEKCTIEIYTAACRKILQIEVKGIIDNVIGPLNIKDNFSNAPLNGIYFLIVRNDKKTLKIKEILFIK